MLDLSRRDLMGTLVTGALMHSQNASAASKPSRYLVIGAGVFGAWTAYSLRKAGHAVTLVDQYGPASSRASSGGETRIIRASYGPDEVYTRMAKRSLSLWTEFFANTGNSLFHRTGVLWMAKGNNQYVEQSRQTLTKVGVPFRNLDNHELRRAYPQIHVATETVAIFEPDSGALMARQAVHALVRQFIKEGGVYRQVAVRPSAVNTKMTEIVTSTGDRLTADAFIFACGPWLGKVFPEVLGKRIFPTRQEVFFFGPPAGDQRFAPPQMPVWIDFSDDRGMYGFPDLENRGFKVAFDLHGPAFDPDNGNRMASAEKIAAARAYVSDRFPALANAPIIETRVCQYENTSNGDFVIDRHPRAENVWLVGGGSGHGFKHGPAVGEYAAARVVGAAQPAIQPRFSLTSKGTEQSRAVY